MEIAVHDIAKQTADAAVKCDVPYRPTQPAQATADQWKIPSLTHPLTKRTAPAFVR